MSSKSPWGHVRNYNSKFNFVHGPLPGSTSYELPPIRTGLQDEFLRLASPEPEMTPTLIESPVSPFLVIESPDQLPDPVVLPLNESPVLIIESASFDLPDLSPSDMSIFDLLE